jgi:hypothetical protein
MASSKLTHVALLVGVLLWTAQPLDGYVVLLDDSPAPATFEWDADDDLQEQKSKGAAFALASWTECKTAHTATHDVSDGFEFAEYLFQWHLRGPPVIL